MAGGVGLNCVANGKILRDGHFKRLWIQPAAGDAGGALGAAFAAHHLHANLPRTRVDGRDAMQGAYLGPSYAQGEIERRLANAGARFTTHDDRDTLQCTVDALVAGHAVGWMQGRMEYGPRALGARSILGDPRNPRMQRNLNLKIKYRESFRPFAPSVLEEDAPDYFSIDVASPYMLLVADVLETRRCRMTEEEQSLSRPDAFAARARVPSTPPAPSAPGGRTSCSSNCCRISSHRSSSTRRC